MTELNAKGACLCGDVTYQITGNLGIFQYCHCSRCRKFTGSAHASNILISPDDFTWLKGEELVGRYEPEESRHFATSFCKRCGSSLPWLAKSGGAVIIPAGTLDDDPGIRPMQKIFCESKAVWHEDHNHLPEYDELPPRK